MIEFAYLINEYRSEVYTVLFLITVFAIFILSITEEK